MGSINPESRLFKPLKIGKMNIKYRIGMAPLTRMRATEDRVPTSLMKEYYSQRASAPGTLIISEGTLISLKGSGGFPGAPGIWSKDQVAAWKTITAEVHRKECFILCQLFASGRAADTETAKKEGVEIIGPSSIPIDENSPTPREMTINEIKDMVEDLRVAAKNAIDAGFDGVEVHGANGYLFDQFNQDTSNKRTDQYGGSVENRSRFLNELMIAAVEAVGADRVGLRLSPWSTFQSMRMADPIPQFTNIIMKANYLNLAYISFIESRMSGGQDADGTESLDFAYKLWKGPFLVAGGYTLAEAQKLVEEEYPEKDIVVLFGRYFISNPDLVYRAQNSLELSPWERKTFYSGAAAGYVDYPFSAESSAGTEV